MDTPTFPVPRTRFAAPDSLAPGLALRPAEDRDVPYLRNLYAASRAAEVAIMPWSDAAKRAFLDSQFDMQHRHYSACYANGEFLIVLYEERPAGRLYLHGTTRELCIVDILLDEAFRGRGIGSILLRWLQEVTKARGLEHLQLSVLVHNMAARRLYERHGFIAGELAGMHIPMTWHP